MIIKEDLRVEGWLEAPNIRPFLKGLFTTTDALCAAYPHPLTGWAALVGKSLPAALYVAEAGRWVATGDTAGAVIATGDYDSERFGDRFSILPSTLKELSPEFEVGKYISRDNRIAEQPGFRLSAPIHLLPGEVIEVRCDTHGQTWPIALEAPYEGTDWHDLPPLGNMDAGMRTYTYYAEAEVDVRISCFSPAESIITYRNTLPFLTTSLRSYNGVRMSMSRKDTGAVLMADGTTAQKNLHGVTDLLPLGSVRFLKYEGYLEAEEGESLAFLIFYGEDGVMWQTHYVGEPAAGSRMVRQEGGAISKVIAVPSGATHVRASSALHSAHPFRVS